MKHIKEFQSFLNSDSPLNEDQIYKYPGDNSYEYRVSNGVWQTKKVGSPTWLSLSKFPATIANLNKQFPNALKGTSSTSKAVWSTSDLKKISPWNQSKPVQRDAFEPYRANTMSKIQMAEMMKKIGVKINKVKKAEPTFWEYLKNAIGRRFIPNVVQLFDSRPLTSQDFTDEQKKVILRVIENSKKRDPRNLNIGSVNYDDYGKEVASRFQNERGSPSMWAVAWHTVRLDQYFAMATLLGKFDWKKLPNGNYLIDDKYDFKDPGYKELIGVNRKSLEGLSVGDLKNKFGFDSYEAARVKGWVEHPDTIPSKSLAIKVEIDPKKLA